MFGLRSVAVFATLLAVTAATASEPAEPAPGGKVSDYRVGIEDLLRIVVWGEPELTTTVTVRPDGKITLPLIQDLNVAGQPPERIGREIAERLAKYVRDPNVTVIVDRIDSFRVYFLGEVNNQGALQFHRPTRLLQALAAAGGLTEFSKKKITLLRQNEGTETRIEIDYKQLAAGAPAQENLFVMPGDTLIVE